MCYSAWLIQNLKELKEKYGVKTDNMVFDAYERASAHDARHFPPIAERIFPGNFAAVCYAKDGERIAEPMRYGAYPPPGLAGKSTFQPFNARHDNLHSPFWSSAYRKHHGFVVLKAFYEWVAVKDLLRANVVGIDEVKATFEKQAAERQAKILAQGKPYKPTPTEKKDPRFRQIIIEFRPRDGQHFIVPVIFNSDSKSPAHNLETHPTADGSPFNKGFAILTDDPPPEIKLAGHDRSPIMIADANAQALDLWLRPKDHGEKELEHFLSLRPDTYFEHALPKIA